MPVSSKDATINFEQGLQWLNEGKSISFIDGQLVVDSFKRRVARILSPKLNAQLVNEVASAALNQKNNTAFAKLLVTRYAHTIDSEQLAKLDHQVTDDGNYLHPQNKAEYARWKRWGYDTNLFQHHHDFARFLLTTPLGSQMKLFNSDDFVQPEGGLISIVDGEPAIIVDGKRTQFSDFSKKFEVTSYESEKMLTAVDEAGQTSVWTYLANGKGLQKHHPYLAPELVPVAKLTKEAFDRTVKHAKGSEKTDFLLQIVSSHVEGNKSNAMELLKNRKHPWIRLIRKREDGTADVYDMGFGWTKPCMLPGRTGFGRFRILDVWNYQTAKERIVTTASIKEDQYTEILKLVNGVRSRQNQLNQNPAFNLFRQNCSAFIGAVGKIVPTLDLNTRITAPKLMYKISPTWIQKVIDVAAFLEKTMHKGVAKLPKPIFTVARAIRSFVVRIFEIIATMPANIISFLAGGTIGETGTALPANGEGGRIGPVIYRSSFSEFFYHLPGIVQEWQLRQESSTSVFRKPVAMAVAPPTNG